MSAFPVGATKIPQRYNNNRYTHTILVVISMSLQASLGSASLNSKAVMSEDVISGKALADVEKRLQGSGRKRIVIVGGSHSAFSAAW